MAKPSLDIGKTALLMIDFQRDFCEVGGYAHACFGDMSWVEQILDPAATLLAAARDASLPLIIHTREGYASDLSDVGRVKMARSEAAGAPIGASGPLGRFLIRGEPGQDTCARVAPQKGEVVLDKTTYGAFCSTDIENRLRASNIQTILFAGVTADVCVHTTLREAVDRGFECWYVKDAISTPDPSLRDACERMVEYEGGIWGRLCTTTEVLKSLQTSAAEDAIPKPFVDNEGNVVFREPGAIAARPAAVAEVVGAKPVEKAGTGGYKAADKAIPKPFVDEEGNVVFPGPETQ
eukprot:gnl/MRDRNA2_/MRDRNA2_15243_c0_seq1.p1 gnl/MRDRNA2_/MRDRNA2_15243_c0~~gnl/MRDRNA2_/MRDRNA2_15243_c0_seq1.p1  ORF type:complete len:293 (-),score=58.07 gnl/MRDRNA2_/MRDRNA2_15243_c0_seq1:55-933(-)